MTMPLAAGGEGSQGGCGRGPECHATSAARRLSLPWPPILLLPWLAAPPAAPHPPAHQPQRPLPGQPSLLRAPTLTPRRARRRRRWPRPPNQPSQLAVLPPLRRGGGGHGGQPQARGGLASERHGVVPRLLAPQARQWRRRATRHRSLTRPASARRRERHRLALPATPAPHHPRHLRSQPQQSSTKPTSRPPMILQHAPPTRTAPPPPTTPRPEHQRPQRRSLPLLCLGRTLRLSAASWRRSTPPQPTKQLQSQPRLPRQSRPTAAGSQGAAQWTRRHSARQLP